MPNPFDISSRYVDELIDLQPMFATRIGQPGHDHLWGDVGLEGHEARTDMVRRTRAELVPHLSHDDPDQRRAAQVLVGTFDETLAADEHGDHFEDLRHMACTFHRLRSIFDVMDKTTAEGWKNITQRLATIGEPFGGYETLLATGVEQRHVVARRQVDSVIDQARRLAGEASAFDALAGQARDAGFHEAALDTAITTAKAAVARFADFLDQEYLPAAAEDDGVGEDRYRRAADRFVGSAVDPHEAYTWGWDELDRLLAQAAEIADRITPGGSLTDAVELLETDPARAAHSPEEFADFIQSLQMGALRELEGTHFDVPEPIREVTVTIAPPGGPLAGYYVSPSEDFTRPGGIWFSIGDQTVFPLYHWVSTAYHEGFPGHHLQIGTAMYHSDRISRGQRLTVWYPGYGEGWALYAERLMGELGYLENPDHHFGMLAKHLYRATRVVVDIGLHLGLDIPATAPMYPGEPWSFERAVDYMKTYGFRTDAQAPNEVLRYLGWAGQAISYKLGEREILAMRRAAQARDGFDPKVFHSKLVGHGSMRLDLLRQVVLDEHREQESDS